MITYMSGAGNLFSVIDNRINKYNFDFYSRNSSKFCASNEITACRTDGLIVMNSSDSEDFNVWFFNPDGSAGMMCGNGGRCAVRFALNNNFIMKNDNRDKFRFSMANTTYSATVNENKIELEFSPPQEIKSDNLLNYQDKKINFTYVNNGSDHICINYLTIKQNVNIRDFEFIEFAKFFRWHDSFPRGVNVNLYEFDNDFIQLRTYERGVEAETGACGTGAIATAISLMDNNKEINRFSIIPTSGEQLEVRIHSKEHKIESIILSGPAKVLGMRDEEILK
ncbi:MAG: diaminopimelate epimerase [Candidatus Kapabacteria bacterium]|nr:diaminopimelate epimerase [Candidatus Kapabacteria bacterium]